MISAIPVRLAASRLAALLPSLLMLLALAWTPPGKAQTALDAALDEFLLSETRGLPGQVSTRIGQIDPRIRQAPCAAYEPFLPKGSTLWGRTTIGLRCLAPTTWTAYLQVNVKVVADYLVAARALPPGSTLDPADIAVRNGDLTTLPASVLTDPAQAIGKTMKSGLGAGQPLRGDFLAAPWVVQQGQIVKTLTRGPGFTVSSEGKALNNAAAGQVVQVRTSGGQTISGIARPGGVVEIAN